MMHLLIFLGITLIAVWMLTVTWFVAGYLRERSKP